MTTEEMRELDAWIAKNVMQWPECVSPMELKCPCFIKFSHGVHYYENLLMQRVFSPTTDPSASRELERKIVEVCSITIHRHPNGLKQFNVQGYKPDKAGDTGDEDNYIEADALTLELALCLFAQKLWKKRTALKEILK